MLTLWLTHIAVFSILIFLIWKFAVRGALRPWFLPALLIKVIFGISLGIIYKFHFAGGDTFTHYSAAEAIAEYIGEQPFEHLYEIWMKDEALSKRLAPSFMEQPRSWLFVKIIGTFMAFTHADYWLLSIWLSLFSLLGIYYLSGKLVDHYPETKDGVIIAFLLFPSFVFWSSGVMKESVVMPLLCLLVAFFLDLYYGTCKRHVPKAAIALLSLFILWKIRVFYIGVLLPVLLSALLIRGMGTAGLTRRYLKRDYVRLLVFLFIFISCITLVSRAGYHLRFENISRLVYENYQQYEHLSEAGKYITYEHLQPSVSSIIRYAPKAWFSAIFRPNVWDVSSDYLGWILILENVFVLIIFGFSLLHLSNLLFLKKIPVVSLILYCTVLAIFLAISSPNFGSLSRYRIGFMPFFVYLSWCGFKNTSLFKGMVKRFLK